MFSKTKALRFIEDFEYNTKISQQGRKWLEANGKAVSTPDFKGYIFRVLPKKHVGVAVSVDGALYVYSLNPKKAFLPFRIFKKALRTMLAAGFLENMDYDDIFMDLRVEDTPLNFDDTAAAKFDECLFKQIM